MLSEGPPIAPYHAQRESYTPTILSKIPIECSQRVRGPYHALDRSCHDVICSHMAVLPCTAHAPQRVLPQTEGLHSQSPALSCSHRLLLSYYDPLKGLPCCQSPYHSTEYYNTMISEGPTKLSSCPYRMLLLMGPTSSDLRALRCSQRTQTLVPCFHGV